MTDAVAEPAGEEPQAPPPQSFNDFPIADDVKEALEAMGYENPTEVQSAVITEALAGKDLVVQSKTGSGKTSAFGIPLVEKIDEPAEPGEPLALILTPTRELAIQVAEELTKVGENRATKVTPIYGGMPIGKQASALKDGVHIVVATPGRLLDHLRRGNLNLNSIRMLVLDEADEMLSMGFWDDVTELWRATPENRQAMLFSATLPYQVAKAAAEFLKQPSRIDLSGDVLTVHGIENVSYEVVPDIPKPRQLLYVLEYAKPKSAIIFCNTRNETEMIAKFLTQSGFVAEALSGSFRQKEREGVMERIKNGELRYMVATDIASRGIDITNLSHVFNYSLPEFTEVYLHRVGRTGRAGNVGTAISLVDGKSLVTRTQLQREFNVKFDERVLPPEEEVIALRSNRIMKELSEKASVAEVGQHAAVAKEIVEADDNQQIVAFLLKNYFANQAGDGRRQSSSSRPPRERDRDGGRDRGRDREASADRGNEEGGRSRRRRRRRGRGRRGGGSMETIDAAAALGDGLPPPVVQPQASSSNGGEAPPPLEPGENGKSRMRVNIGFDDGFKGRGAVAKKITALAGLNDGIVHEIESRRNYVVLEATPEIVELLIERVDGAQIGKKVVQIESAGG